MKNKLIFLFLLTTFLISGCTNNNKEIPAKDQAKEYCIQECKNRLDMGMNLEDGPCLSDGDFNWMIEDWVCDVAHNPREDVDNLEENQCQAYREEEAHHFVEVDPDCNFIKAV